MTPTFGELAEVAEIQLKSARRYALFSMDEGELVHIAGTVRTCVDAVVRLADSTRRDHRAVLDPDSRWQQPLQDFLTHLDGGRVRTRALPHASGEVGGPAPTQRLAGAATAIGAAVDLLATHFDVRPEGVRDRDDLAGYIDSIEGRRAVAVRAARFAALLAPIARDLALATYAQLGRRSGAVASVLLDVAENLAAAAAQLSPTPGGDTHERTALAAMPAATRLRPDSATGTRDAGLLLDQGISCAQRIHQVALVDAARATGPTTDPTALAVTASAFASVQAMTARCLRHLSDHAQHIAPELTAARIAHDIRNGASEAEYAYQRWLDVRDALRGARGLVIRGAGIPMRVEAGNLVLAIGRLVHADPQWEPRAGQHDMRAPKELAPNPVKLGELCAGVRRLSAVQALTAQRHAQLIRDMASNDQFLLPTRWLPESDDVRRLYTRLPDDEAAVLIKRYVAARDATAEAAHRIGQIPQLLGCVRADIESQQELTTWRLPNAWRTSEGMRTESRAPISVAL